MQPRITPCEGPYTPETAGAFARVMPPGMEPLKLFKTMAHSPRVLQRLFAGNLLDPGTLSLRDREMLILRTCARCGCDYEWSVHAALFSQAAQLSAAEVAATQAANADDVLLRAADELHDTSTLSDGVWAELAQRYEPAQLLEILALCGYYHSIAFIANACRVAPEAWAA
ncbi:hypothetical protein GCM10027277_49660 [Pseudoduganella ginsengisoli]|uniref:Carboxymuconolactone decarboxylase family protein n=1 Tax=Pseudoduganella ginsengisoli TaxID=1462440 RepID=A0A6L6Q4Z2_9BURK|nr:carboxymuconolactone decarboxylase family protein [Pseudoduganella ginsengisoli]MTW04586.1 carboxymuconolactone decarboxylase family protein [Pseudoduganella ginsengisoli]